MRMFLAVASLAVCLVLAGCKDPYGACAKTSETIATAIANAYPVIDQDRRAGVLTPEEEANIAGYLNFANSLNGQFQSCIMAAHTSKSVQSAFLVCAQTFAVGLSSPTEVANLKVKQPAEAQKIEALALAISGGLQTLVSSLGGSPAIASAS